MPSLESIITKLSDEQAFIAIRRFRDLRRDTGQSLRATSQAPTSIARRLSLPTEQIAKPSKGDVARAVLLLLASDPASRDLVAFAVEDPGLPSFAPAALPVTADDLLAVVESQLPVSGRTSVFDVQDSARTSLLRSAAQQVLAFAGLHTATAQSDAEYRVWFATTRRPIASADPSRGFGAERDNRVHYGSCSVFVPRSHKIGSIGTSWWKRVMTLTDDRLRLLLIEPSSVEQFWRDVSAQLSSCPPDERDAVVFVHGFNVDFKQAALRAAQIGFDLQIQGAMAFYSWASHGTIAGYLADEASVELDELVLEDFLCDFATRTSARQVHVIAHSMGNRAVLRAVDRIAAGAQRRTAIKFGQCILAAPDVDARKFEQLCGAYRLVSTNTTMYVSRRDVALGASDWLHDFPRAGLIPPVTIAPHIDTIDVANCDLTLLGHGYVAEQRAVLADMHSLIHNGALPPRFGLQKRRTEQGNPYWQISA